MTTLALFVIAASVLLFAYTYFGYPAILHLIGRHGVDLPSPGTGWEWPTVSISVPAYNEEAQIEELIKSLLALDYPKDRLQILIVSDASEDGTDDIVRKYANQGIQLLRLEGRGGKTKAENAAAEHLTGEIVVNTDASIRIRPDALKPLIAVFSDPDIGCASGRDVSVGSDEETANVGESGYVGYEMGVRDLETRVLGIVGASGCFYAIRSHLHRLPLPESLSRDFAAALHTREHGYRPVSVNDAVCYVPRTTSLRKEYRRKVRTISRGMRTLWHKRALMNPSRHGLFSWMLVSHKVCRWALPWAALAAALAVAALVPAHPMAGVPVVLGGIVFALAAIGWWRAEDDSVPKIYSIPAFLVAGNLAAMHAFLRAAVGVKDALWEPTRREVVKAD
ncbi:MAG: glycosyltransferase family 2 protein [Gemmatimonadetes bacterium]|nr:glycosyltransferase family 2 protein [Gemmatimonadota bacterium]